MSRQLERQQGFTFVDQRLGICLLSKAWWLRYTFKLLLMVSLLLLPDQHARANSQNESDTKLINQQIRYHIKEAYEVMMIWWVDGWKKLPTSALPEHTTVEGGAMHTVMKRMDKVFVADLKVPLGAVVGYIFRIIEMKNGQAMESWDQGRLLQPYYDTLVLPMNQVVDVRARVDRTVLFASQVIRYRLATASEVFLVWWTQDGSRVSDKRLPAGTLVEGRGFTTPMSREDDAFVTTLSVPAGTLLGYTFHITKMRTGEPVDVWDTNGWEGGYYASVALPNARVEVSGRPPSPLKSSSLVAQTFQYRKPEAGEIVLVWGVNGWKALPEARRPPGTVMHDQMMLTPMVKSGDLFSVEIEVPLGAIVDYGYLMTKQRDGTDIEDVWDGAYQTTASSDGAVLKRPVSPSDGSETGFANSDMGRYSIVTIIMIAIVAMTLTRVIQKRRHRVR